MGKFKTKAKKWMMKGVSALCAATLLSAVPAAALAEASSSSVSAEEGLRADVEGVMKPTSRAGRMTGSLKEQALKIAGVVKKKIDLPKGKKEFSFDTYGENGERWRFKWEGTDDSWSMDVTCDSEGRITGMNFNEYGKDEEDRPKFKYIGKKLEKLMEEKLEQLIPSTKGNIKITNYWYNSVSGEVRFEICRTANGIPVPDNGIYVSMDTATGVMTEMYGNWDYDISFPKNENVISKDEAKKIGKQALNMELNYYLKYEMINVQKKSANDNGRKAKGILGYEPDKKYIAINAFSGKVYESREAADDDSSKDEGAFGEINSAEDSITGSGSANKGDLTQEEIDEIEKLEGVMEAEEAAALVMEKKGLYHPANMKYKSGELYRKKVNGEDLFYWTVRFSIDKDNENMGSAYAKVEAKTGEIITYDVYERNRQSASSANLSKETLRETAISYMKENYPLFADKVKCSDEEYEDYYYINQSKMIRGYSFNFVRQVNDVPCRQNYINISVTADKGEIYEISRYWEEENVEFEGKGGIISVDKAKDFYFDSGEFELVYEINKKKDGTKAARLVYSTQNIYPDIIKASNGKRMNQWGEIYKKEENNKEYKYTDIGKSEYKDAIEFLAELNIGFDSDRFYPDRAITREEMIELTDQCTLWRINWGGLDDGTSKEISRIEITRLILDSLGYGDALKYSDIYTADFDDWNSIKKADKGYAALAGAKGLFWNGKKHLSGKFNAGKSLTRGEAASLIMTLYRS